MKSCIQYTRNRQFDHPSLDAAAVSIYTECMLNFVTTALALGLSLAVDAFVVSIALSLKQKLSIKTQLGMVATFGGLQGLMPAIGWQGGSLIAVWSQLYSQWISFALLCIVGGRMVYNAISASEEAVPNQLSAWTIFSLGIATSIDALAVGITLPTLTTYPAWMCLSIAIITASVCSIGLFAARAIPQRIGKPAEIFAGIVLVSLGLKLLLL